MQILFTSERENLLYSLNSISEGASQRTYDVLGTGVCDVKQVLQMGNWLGLGKVCDLFTLSHWAQWGSILKQVLISKLLVFISWWYGCS